MPFLCNPRYSQGPHWPHSQYSVNKIHCFKIKLPVATVWHLGAQDTHVYTELAAQKVRQVLSPVTLHSVTFRGSKAGGEVPTWVGPEACRLIGTAIVGREPRFEVTWAGYVPLPPKRGWERRAGPGVRSGESTLNPSRSPCVSKARVPVAAAPRGPRGLGGQRAGEGPVRGLSKRKESWGSEPRQRRQAWAEGGMSPTCATSSPSFKYRIGAGWAGTQVSLLQPQANAPSPRPSRRLPRSFPEAAECGTQAPGRTGRTDGGADRDPPPAWAPLLAPARPGQGCPRHVRRRAPALRRPLPPPPRLLAAVPAALRVPTPALSP